MSRLIVPANRRQFIAGAASLGASICAPAVWANKVPRIKRVARRDETIKRLDVSAGYFAMTWAADDRQLVVCDDGVDLAEPPTKAYHSRIFAIAGDPTNPAFQDVPGYPDMPMRMRESDYASFWGGPCLAVDGRVYQFLANSNNPYFKPDGSFWPDFYMANAALIYSPDNGRTWCNQDGSSPIVWPNWNARSRKNLVFFNEQPEGAFAWPTFLQMGRNYELNKDGYVYVYSANGNVDGTANELVMFRVPKSRIPDRGSYEFFSGRRSDGSATWTSDISARSAVHTFPRGRVSSKFPGAVPSGWSTSVVYNAPLGLYLLAAQGTGPGEDGRWYGKPSYLGFWVAPTPWGPFTQAYEELAWTPANQLASRAFAPQIAPKWISADGKSFWLVWSDYGSKPAPREYNPDKHATNALKDITDDAEFARALKAWNKEHQLNVAFNMQRVDVSV
jgi:hypothetical protein